MLTSAGSGDVALAGDALAAVRIRPVRCANADAIDRFVRQLSPAARQQRSMPACAS